MDIQKQLHSLVVYFLGLENNTSDNKFDVEVKVLTCEGKETLAPFGSSI